MLAFKQIDVFAAIKSAITCVVAESMKNKKSKINGDDLVSWVERCKAMLKNQLLIDCKLSWKILLSNFVGHKLIQSTQSLYALSVSVFVCVQIICKRTMEMTSNSTNRTKKFPCDANRVLYILAYLFEICTRTEWHSKCEGCR